MTDIYILLKVINYHRNSAIVETKTIKQCVARFILRYVARIEKVFHEVAEAVVRLMGARHPHRRWRTGSWTIGRRASRSHSSATP